MRYVVIKASGHYDNVVLMDKGDQDDLLLYSIGETRGHGKKKYKILDTSGISRKIVPVNALPPGMTSRR